MADHRMTLKESNVTLRDGQNAAAIGRYLQILKDSSIIFPHLVGANIAVARGRYRRQRDRAGDIKVAIGGWDLAGGDLDRLHLLAGLYSPHAEVEIVGSTFVHQTPTLAPQLDSVKLPVRSFIVPRQERFLQQALTLVAAHPYDVVHLAGARMPNILLGLLYKLAWDALVLVDLEPAASEEPGNEPMTCTESGLPGPSGWPPCRDLLGREWSSIARVLAQELDGVTVADAALRDCHGGTVVADADSAAPQRLKELIGSTRRRSGAVIAERPGLRRLLLEHDAWAELRPLVDPTIRGGPKAPLVKKGKIPKRISRQIGQLRIKLFELGFHRRAVRDLVGLLAENREPGMTALAARELARWYANQRTPAGARNCLPLLQLLRENTESVILLRQAAVLAAECHELLQEPERGRQVLQEAVAEQGEHADLFLALANLEPVVEDRLKWVNKALRLHDLSAISLAVAPDLPPFDRLKGEDAAGTAAENSVGPKVTVIMPVYNAAGFIATALHSVLAQTWSNLEVLVVDDASTDDTVARVEEFARRDSRVQVLPAKVNAGPYVARNLALQQATGELITFHDADDWSHPQAIARQVAHLQANPQVMANIGMQVRVTPELKCCRRGNHGRMVTRNFPSFMFRREPVFAALGYYDGVRFSADHEYIRRARMVFGDDAVATIETGPICLQRHHLDSLTHISSSFGADGFLFGARRLYFNLQISHHSQAENLYYPFMSASRPFPVPEPLLKKYKLAQAGVRYFDVIVASDFRAIGTELHRQIQEIENQRRRGKRVGLLQLYSYEANAKSPFSPEIIALLDGDVVQFLAYGENLSCETVVVIDANVLDEQQHYVPAVKANSVKVVVTGCPSSVKPATMAGYNIKRGNEQLLAYFGRTAVWCPVNSEVRAAMLSDCPDQVSVVDLAEENWETG
ncbi:glycosyltransferase family 2 protein [Desulfurivibrio dismutans]|uniref:glycosyltransferase family 2 protein n=1 Tax=Desulfurivibrio dismutans TaxID=1398908 RepID=UPI0023D997AC|nr:glycosyltransferase family A protein [Desulfurivibrio alkaliphilus]MDF1615240.1 glycosyltransferase family A protein [Desulfurivibrio alkaliphilus]